MRPRVKRIPVWMHTDKPWGAFYDRGVEFFATWREAYAYAVDEAVIEWARRVIDMEQGMEVTA